MAAAKLNKTQVAQVQDLVTEALRQLQAAAPSGRELGEAVSIVLKERENG